MVSLCVIASLLKISSDSFIDLRRTQPESISLVKRTAGGSPEKDKNLYFFLHSKDSTMSSVHNSVETVNAAATAIVTAETRVQPSTVQVYTYIKSCFPWIWKGLDLIQYQSPKSFSHVEKNFMCCVSGYLVALFIAIHWIKILGIVNFLDLWTLNAFELEEKVKRKRGKRTKLYFFYELF